MSASADFLTDERSLKDNLISSLRESEDQDIKKLSGWILDVINKHVENITSNPDDLNVLLMPYVSTSLEFYSNGPNWRFYYRILFYIFIEPIEREPIRMFDIIVEQIRDENLLMESQKWKIRDNVDIKFHNLVSMLFDVRNEHVDVSTVIPDNVYQHIKSWLDENTPLIKSSNKQ